MLDTMLPLSASLYVTYHCQLQCKHCFLTQSVLLNSHQLDKNKVFKVIDDAAKHKVLMIIVSGGDPFLHPDVFEILEYIKSNNILPLIGASGINLNEMYLEKLCQLNIPCIQVSLDGAYEQDNDDLRGIGSFREIRSAIHRIDKYGIHANLAFAVNNKNIHSLSEIIEFAATNNVYRLKVDFWRPSKNSDDYDYRELDNNQKKYVIKTCHQANRYLNKPNWIDIPGYDMQTGERRKNKYPPLTIGADGVITMGELGEVIGDIGKCLPSLAYAKAMRKMRLRSLSNIVFRYAKANNITEITYLPRKKLPHNAIVFKKRDGYAVFINSDLHPFLQLFTILHEIGHIETGSIFSKLGGNYQPDVEERVNKWALNRLTNIVDYDFLLEAKNAATHESLLYGIIAEKLEKNISTYLE